MTDVCILVVSDNPLLRAVVDTALREAGYRALAATPPEALGIAHELQPQAIVLDARASTPRAALLRLHLRLLPSTAAIPLVLLHDHAATPRSVTLTPDQNALVIPPEQDSGAAVVGWLHHHVLECRPGRT